MGSMQDFNQFLDIDLEDYRTLKDPYEVQRQAVRGDAQARIWPFALCLHPT